MSGTSTKGATLWAKVKRVWRFLFGMETVRHARWETLLFRIGIALVVWDTLSRPSPFISQPIPHGFATWGWDFSWIGDAALLDKWLAPLWIGCLLLFVLNVLPVLALIPVTVASIGHGTLGNSQGSIGHTTQAVTVMLMALWLAAVWTHVCRLRRQPLPHDYRPDQLSIDWARQIFMGTYVVSALVKLHESGGNWLKDTPYFGLQIAKSTGMAYHTHLLPPDNAGWLAQFFVDHPYVAQVFIGFGLPLELFAFLALCNRRSALLFGIGLYSLHWGITEAMNLGFVYHKALLLFLLVNPIWWAFHLVEKARLWLASRRVSSRTT